MGTLSASMLLPSKLKPLFSEDHHTLSFRRYCRSPPKKGLSFCPWYKRGLEYKSRLQERDVTVYRKQHKLKILMVMRLFGPAIFEASKLEVLFLGVDEEKHPPKLPRTYTFTHSDITSKLTLAISPSINNSQMKGWYNKLQRDEVVAEWKKVKGKMSLHVHCHISGGHFLLDLLAPLRYYIFCKELPVVLKAFVHGDENLFKNYPEIQKALVWVYFHSNTPGFNKVECWGSLKDAVALTSKNNNKMMINNQQEVEEAEEESSMTINLTNSEIPEPCKEPCLCCYPPTSSIPWIHSLQSPQLQENTSAQGSKQS